MHKSQETLNLLALDFDWNSKVKMHNNTLTNTFKLRPETGTISSDLCNAMTPLSSLYIEWMSWIYATSENILLEVFTPQSFQQ